MRLIDADALSESIRSGSGTELQKFFADVCVATAPTVDAVPVVHGRWEWIEDNSNECSVCRYTAFFYPLLEAVPNYCPKCGAKMDLEVDGNGKTD